MLKKLFRQLGLLFTRHEMWVLRAVERHPYFSFFAIGTFFVWSFPFLLVVSPLIIFVALTQSTISWIIFGLVGLIVNCVLVPWYFTWCFIYVSSLCGYGALADKKAEVLEQRLRQLTLKI